MYRRQHLTGPRPLFTRQFIRGANHPAKPRNRLPFPMDHDPIVLCTVTTSSGLSWRGMESNHHLRIFSPPHRPALLPLHWWTSTTPSPVAASSVPNFRQREAFHSCCCQLLAHTISSVPSAAVKIQSPPEGRFIRYLQTLGPTWKVSVPPSGYLYRQAHW